ncbi:hypothetical protein WJX74_010915 [Apatococcus lobatus]|uniref:Uncharacterized protein n=1 Tax=Apatococcus lobatus TaxID=904363 RepID=A0AAW1QK95_9CHLO
MDKLLELDSKSVQEAYFARQQQITSEFHQWLARLPWERDMYSCTPEDVAFFCTTSYLQQHTAATWTLHPMNDLQGHFFSVHPYGTKTQHPAHAGSAILQYNPVDSTCPIRWLSLSLQHASTLRQPISSWLYRTLDSQGRVLTESPLTSTALNNRLTLHLKAADLYHGQTPHGMRRGHIQHLHHQQYMSLAAASSNAGIKTLSVAAMYADSHSHQRQGRLQ